MWWEPEPRSSQPGWDSRGPFERLPEPAWSSSGYGTPSAGTDCGTATPGSETPGRLSHCCRRGAARSPALWRNDATEPGYTNAGVANKGNNIRSETEASRIWPAVIWQTAWVEVRVRCGRFSPSLKMLGVPPIRDALRLMGGERWAKSGLDEPPDVYQNTHRCSGRLQVETRTINLRSSSLTAPTRAHSWKVKTQREEKSPKRFIVLSASLAPLSGCHARLCRLSNNSKARAEAWIKTRVDTHTHNEPTLLLNALKRLNVWAHVDGFLFFSGSLSVWTPPSQVWASGFSLLRCERHQPCFSQTTANLTARTGDAHCVLEMCHSVRVHGGGLHGVCFTLDGEGGEEDSCAIRKQ